MWQAAREGLAVLGINDHYTVAGHEEFRRACEVAGIAAAFSLEAVAMDREAAEAGLKLNDPDNPGRIYLCGKGVTQVPPGIFTGNAEPRPHACGSGTPQS